MKKLVLMLTITTLFLMGCNKEEVVEQEEQNTTSATLSVDNGLGDFNYHMIIDENGNEVLEDDNGNIIEKDDNGDFIDSDGNVIDYSEQSEDNELVITAPVNEEAVSIAESIKEEEDKNKYHDPRLDDLEFDNANEGEDYDINYGNKVAQSGTVIEQTLFTYNEIPINAKITLNTVSVSGNTASVSYTITYDYNELLQSVVDNYETEEDAKASLASEMISSYIYMDCGNVTNYSDTNNQTLSETGSLSGSLTVENTSDEPVNAVAICINDTNIKIM